MAPLTPTILALLVAFAAANPIAQAPASADPVPTNGPFGLLDLAAQAPGTTDPAPTNGPFGLRNRAAQAPGTTDPAPTNGPFGLLDLAAQAPGTTDPAPTNGPFGLLDLAAQAPGTTDPAPTNGPFGLLNRAAQAPGTADPGPTAGLGGIPLVDANGEILNLAGGTAVAALGNGLGVSAPGFVAGSLITGAFGLGVGGLAPLPTPTGSYTSCSPLPSLPCHSNCFLDIVDLQCASTDPTCACQHLANLQDSVELCVKRDAEVCGSANLIAYGQALKDTCKCLEDSKQITVTGANSTTPKWTPAKPTPTQMAGYY